MPRAGSFALVDEHADGTVASRNARSVRPDRLGRQSDDRARRPRRAPARARCGRAVADDDGGRCAAVPAGGRGGWIEPSACVPARSSPSATCCSRCCCRPRTTSRRSLAVWVSGNRDGVHRSAERHSGRAGYGAHPFRGSERARARKPSPPPRISCCSPGRRHRNPALAALVGHAAGRPCPTERVLHNLDIVLGRQPGLARASRPAGPVRRAAACSSPRRDAYGADHVVTVWGAVLGQPTDDCAATLRIPSSAQPSSRRRTRGGRVLGATRG